MANARQINQLDLGHGFELFGVDDHALPGQRNGAAGITSAAAARHDGQAQLDAALDQVRHLGLGVGGENHKRVFDPPVGGVGHVAHTREAVKLDVVLGRQAAQHTLHLAAQLRAAGKTVVEIGHGSLRQRQQFTHQSVTGGVSVGGTALLHLAQAVLQGFDQQFAARGVVQQVVLQIGVALDHPDVAQHFVEHAGRAAGAALLAQLVQQLPGLLAQQANDNFAVGEAGVVVRNFTQTGRVRLGLHQVL